MMASAVVCKLEAMSAKLVMAALLLVLGIVLVILGAIYWDGTVDNEVVVVSSVLWTPRVSSTVELSGASTQHRILDEGHCTSSNTS